MDFGEADVQSIREAAAGFVVLDAEQPDKSTQCVLKN